MALREELEREGQWLFQWRSYLPLVITGLVLLVMRHFAYPQGSHRLDEWWEAACVAISCVGLGIRAFTIGTASQGTSGRNTHGQVAESLNTTGLYSVVRHPLYLGNFFMGLGISLVPRTWWFSLIYVLMFWLYYERIMFAEEEFLRRKFGRAYTAWADATPAFCPNLRRWTRPTTPFALRWVIKRENSSCFAVITTFTLLEVLGDWFAKRRLILDGKWVAVFGVAVVVYLTIRVLGKKTRLLDGQGR